VWLEPPTGPLPFLKTEELKMIERTLKTLISISFWALLLGAAAEAQPPAAGLPAPGPAPLIPQAQPVRSCESLTNVSLPNTLIESAAVDGNACRVTAVTTHPPMGDRVTIWIGLPMSGWNGRFVGNGGGGFSGGSAGAIDGPIAQGFAAGATDTGHEGGSGSFALGDDGKLDWQLIRDNGHVGIHEMTVTGKALTAALYGEAPRYSYFNGCSTGGRQGLMEAQRYPEDYDGIASGAPAINWPKLHVQQLWGPMLMNSESHPIAPCKLAAVTAAAIEACDAIDGVEDSLIDPSRCDYDANDLVGTSTECGTFTAADASIVNRIWEGPKRVDGSELWIGATRGSDLNALSTSRGTPLAPQAMGITLEWWKYFLTRDPDFDWMTVTPERYERFFEQSVEEFGLVIGTDNPDLRPFRDRGGKAIVWHGLADQLISAAGSTDYYERVLAEMGGARQTESFIRLFLAPGVGHCGGGGPSPTGLLEAVIAWVEQGEAPDSLMAAQNQGRGGGVIRTRPLCPYPRVARYRGRGDTDAAESFTCSADY
jgi:Tannase and feruloyl esterase